MVFPIDTLNDITEIKVEFYQLPGSFYDINNQLIPLVDQTIDKNNIETSIYGYNLFVKNIYLCFGYDVSETRDELVVPVIDDSMTYSEFRTNNNKTIGLRWVH
jgi:hypothetical protein